jgi:hypothetical protein
MCYLTMYIMSISCCGFHALGPTQVKLRCLKLSHLKSKDITQVTVLRDRGG